MDLFEKYGQVDQMNEFLIKKQYDHIMNSGIKGYCLVVIGLKNFLMYSHLIGHEESEDAIHECFNLIGNCLGKDEYIVRTHTWYFNLLVKCEGTEEALHPRAAEFHFSVRDIMEERYGKKLYLEMGFYPMIKPGVDFYNARYLADLCRMSACNLYPESNYDMYYVSFEDQYEEFLKYEKRVVQALEKGDFKLFLQPKVDMRTGKVHSAEALMRWIDPELGMIPLSSFLPNLEENGFIREVDLYLFDVACRNMDQWFHQYGKKVEISFNLSKAYFNGPYFMPEYKKVFHKYKIPTSCIRIELLESIVLNDLENLLPLVEEIYDFGFSCALDDFGSGFSSFDVLINVRLSELKIDRSLFRNIDNEKERFLIKHIIDIAHDMDMTVVAEGIETEAYSDYLKELGCDYIQGFLYYRPMPVEEFEKRFVLGEERQDDERSKNNGIENNIR